MLCRVCLLGGATRATLTFTDGERISLDLCEGCVGRFGAEALVEDVATR